VSYANELYVGDECGLRDCYFNDTMKVPPKAFEHLIPDYLRVLTLYALGVDATRAACPTKIAQALFRRALATITAIEARNLKFQRIGEVKADLTARLVRLGHAP
jgi:hypothetical protein